MATGKDVVVAAGSGDPFEASESSKALEAKRSDGKVAMKGHLERGWVKHRLIREFALGEKTGQQLAAEYGVSANSISLFKRRNAMAIEDVRNALADEFASLWVAKKMSRIAELQEAADKMAKGSSPRNAEVLVSILKAAAEELGQLPARTQVNVSTESVTYQVVGINPEDLT